MDALSFFRCRVTVTVWRAVFAFLLVGLTTPPARATTIRVPSEEPSIRAGIRAAASGDTVLVAPGVYSGPDNVNISFNGKNIVVVSEAGPEVTIVDVDAFLGPDGGFLFIRGEDSTAVLDGFTIKNAWFEFSSGAGIGISNASPTIRNCIIRDNWVAGHSTVLMGGGVGVGGGSPTFVNCQFVDNGVWFLGEPPGHEAYGGGFFCTDASPTLINCTFVGNMAIGAEIQGHYYSGLGGAIAGTFSSLNLFGSTFHDNSASLAGGGLSLGAGVTTIENSIIAFGSGGGAIDCLGECDIQLRCCDIFGNVGGDWEGEIAGQLGINGNISMDPLFCNLAVRDLTIDARSPCAPGNSFPGCGLIGAWPVGCGPVSVAGRTPDANRIRLTIIPNPVRSGATFTFDGIESPALEIYDPNGRLIDLLRPTGHSATWLPGSEVRSGVYFARLRGAGGTRVVKFLVVK